MDVTIDIPEEVARVLEARWGDLPRRVLEAVATEAYRADVLTAAEVGRMLGFSSRWETEAFLKNAGAHLTASEAELRDDVEAVRRAAG